MRWNSSHRFYWKVNGTGGASPFLHRARCLQFPSTQSLSVPTAHYRGDSIPLPTLCYSRSRCTWFPYLISYCISFRLLCYHWVPVLSSGATSPEHYYCTNRQGWRTAHSHPILTELTQKQCFKCPLIFYPSGTNQHCFCITLEVWGPRRLCHG